MSCVQVGLFVLALLANKRYDINALFPDQRALWYLTALSIATNDIICAVLIALIQTITALRGRRLALKNSTS